MERAYVAIFSRNSPDVLWWHEYAAINFPDYFEYVHTKFLDNGKLVVEFTEIDDKLTLLRVADFKDEEAENEWLTDDVIQTMVSVRDAYNLENNITRIG